MCSVRALKSVNVMQLCVAIDSLERNVSLSAGAASALELDGVSLEALVVVVAGLELKAANAALLSFDRRNP